MKKMQKRLMTSLCVVLLLISSSSMIFATDINSGSTGESLQNDGVWESIPLTKDQAIVRLSQIAGVSMEEAKVVLEKGDSAESRDVARGYDYQEWNYTKSAGAGYIVEVGCLCKMAIGSGHSGFDGIVSNSVYSLATGTGPYKWVPGYSNAVVLNAGQLKLNARGVVEINYATTVNASVGYELVSAGFSATNNQYFRKSMSLDNTITLPWYQ